MPESNEIENEKLKIRSEFSETAHAVIPRAQSGKRSTGWHLPTKKPGAAMNPYLFGRAAVSRDFGSQACTANIGPNLRSQFAVQPTNPSAEISEPVFCTDTPAQHCSGIRPEPCRKPRSSAPARKPGARPGPRFALRVRIRGGWHRRRRVSPTRRIRSRAPPRGRSPKPSPSA